MTMRKVFLAVLCLCALRADAQYWYRETPDALFVDASFRKGSMSNKLAKSSLLEGYTNPVNADTSNLKFTQTSSFEFDVDLGWYFGEKRSFGIGTGLYIMVQNSQLGVDKFHVEYQSADFKSDVFRQIVTASNGISESIHTTIVNLPLLLRYRGKIAENLYLSVDGGALLNLSATNEYKANASFDYEAIYKFAGSGAYKKAVYETAATPTPDDWIVTQQYYNSKNPNGSAQEYFNGLYSLGYNVGLDQDINNKTGTVKYKQSSQGYMLQAAIEHKLYNRMFLEVGLYYMYQSFTTEQTASLPITGAIGDYNALVSKVQKVDMTAYGIRVGVKLFINK